MFCQNNLFMGGVRIWYKNIFLFNCFETLRILSDFLFCGITKNLKLIFLNTLVDLYPIVKIILFLVRMGWPVFYPGFEEKTKHGRIGPSKNAAANPKTLFQHALSRHLPSRWKYFKTFVSKTKYQKSGRNWGPKSVFN